MLVGGILVGSAGIILTVAMCKAMNRTLLSVIFGSFTASAGPEGTNKALGSIKSTTASDTAIIMNYATNVIIVPGYGLAVAQAQHVAHELEELLVAKGVNVKYAIHPVAGRMPGHMNVLLAESNVDYSMLVEMEDINPQFNNADVVLVVGANDVVNPAAHNDPSSPIYGMPILDVEKSKSVLFVKRGLSSGYAGVDNELFYRDNTLMLFSDAKKMVEEISKALD
jgi:NAD(P) transhydrogenase subunit beta